MFTYINPEIRERLIHGKLIRINAKGQEVDMVDAPGPGLHVNLMGSSPALVRGKAQFHRALHAVRSTELTEVEISPAHCASREDSIFFPTWHRAWQ